MCQVWAPELSSATPGCPWACSKLNARCNISIDVTGVGLEHLGRCDRHHLLHRGALAVGFAWIFAISTWTSLVKPEKRGPWNSVTRCSSSTSLSCFILWPRKTVVLSTNQGLDNYFSSDISPDSFSNGAIRQRCNKRPIKHLWYVYLLGECISNAAHTRGTASVQLGNDRLITRWCEPLPRALRCQSLRGPSQTQHHRWNSRCSQMCSPCSEKPALSLKMWSLIPATSVRWACSWPAKFHLGQTSQPNQQQLERKRGNDEKADSPFK